MATTVFLAQQDKDIAYRQSREPVQAWQLGVGMREWQSVGGAGLDFTGTCTVEDRGASRLT